MQHERRVQGTETLPEKDLAEQRQVVAAFLAAVRGGDFNALIAVLDPNVLVRADAPPGPQREIRGAANWAKAAVAFSRQVQSSQAAILDGSVGVILAPQGRLFRALRFTFAGGKIAGVDVISDPARLSKLDVSVLDI
jgi:RNA polymerase sigma-70 factor (ECF subfamily)